MENILEIEAKTYEENKAKLIGESKGKFVLIKSSEIIDIFDNRFDAIRAGFLKYGSDSFFVKQILDFEQTQNFMSNSIGV